MPTTLTADRTRPRTVVAASTVLCLLAIVAAIALSLLAGSKLLSPAQVLEGLTHAHGEASNIVRGGRIPRTVMAILVGAALGGSGAVMQSLTRNPLADPGLLGINAGASAAVVTAIALLGLTQPAQYVWVALIGAGVASVLVYLLGSTRGAGADPVRMALGGTAIGAVLTAYVTGQMLLHPTRFYAFRYWEIGALTGRGLDVLWAVGPFLAVGLVATFALAGPLNALAMGEETATALGANVPAIRVVAVGAITLLCGAATAAAGPIGFVGLAVPHMARMIVGPDERRRVPFSILLGVLLLLLADVAGRFLVWPSEVGAGIVTAVVGAPVLILLVRRGRVARG